VEADTLEGLFEEAALGMLSIMAEPSRDIGRGESAGVSIETDDIEGLMFEWLNELLYIMDTRGGPLSGVRVEELRGSRLRATVWLEEAGQSGKRPIAEIKAATFHQLLVEKRGDSWFARVILDV